MRLARTISVLTALLLGAATGGSAFAQQRGSGGGGGYRGSSGHGAPGGYAGGGGYRGHGVYGGYSGYRGHGGYYGHGHSHYGVGVYLGGPAFWYYPTPYYYPPNYAPYYYPPTYGVPPYPTEYVERDSAPAATPRADSYWYFCPESNAYYPYVKQCPGGWQRVAPVPPPESGAIER